MRSRQRKVRTKEKIQKQNVVKNQKMQDNAAKLTFDDPILCAQFLRGYTNLDFLKNVKPEDIEDISERFLPLWQEGRDSDSVKKVHLKDTALFLITIIEHQSKVHYDMAFRVLRYIVMVLNDYAQEQEKLHPGITNTKDFKYPPILPIVYYEGSGEWTAVRNFKDRVYLSDVLDDFIPDFEYLMVPLVSYSTEELIQKKDELSLIFLINKLRSSEDFKTLKEIPEEYFEHLEANTPEYLLDLIGKIVAVFLYRMNIPRKEVEAFTDRIKRRDFDMMFDSFEAYDVQETRRVSKAEGRKEGRKEGLKEGIEKGIKEGFEKGVQDGKKKSTIALIEKVRKKLDKGKTLPQIADELEEDQDFICKICEALEMTDSDCEKAYLFMENTRV